jgi:transposase-like protein
MTLVMVYTCTFLVFHIVILQKHYPDLKKEVMSPFGKCMQEYKPEKIFYNRMKISKFIVDETQIKVGKDYFWLWVAIKPKDKDILHIHISAERNMFVAEHFLRSLVKKYGKYPDSTDGGTRYPQACKFLQIKKSSTFTI